jgi:hypothetical protein
MTSCMAAQTDRSCEVNCYISGGVFIVWHTKYKCWCHISLVHYRFRHNDVAFDNPVAQDMGFGHADEQSNAVRMRLDDILYDE